MKEQHRTGMKKENSEEDKRMQVRKKTFQRKKNSFIQRRKTTECQRNPKEKEERRIKENGENAKELKMRI